MKVVIIGGVAGGASAPAPLRPQDEQAEIRLFEPGENNKFSSLLQTAGCPITSAAPSRNGISCSCKRRNP